MKILITGGTGFVGTYLIQALQNGQHGFPVGPHHITILTRRLHGDETYAPQGINLITSLEELSPNEAFDVVINLAGEPIAAKKWSAKQKSLILESRLVGTRRLVAWIEKNQKKPKVFISCSAVGYYGAMGEEIIDERVKVGHEFTSKVCAAWEYEARRAEPSCRTVIMRLGVVLGKPLYQSPHHKGGDFLSRLMLPARLGCSPRMGQGEHYLSWIHITDLLRAMAYFLQNTRSQGVYNLTAPQPIKQKDFAKVFMKAARKNTLFFMPKFVIKLMFGEMGDRLLLHGQRVVPKKLLSENFSFIFASSENALSDVFQ